MSLTEIDGHSFGDEFLEAFEVQEVIGSGLSGLVLRAYQLSLQRQVAIKVLNKQSMEATALQSRFKREAHILGELSHPNIIKIFDYGFDGDTPYLVQEFLEGSSLEEWLQVKAQLTPEEVLRIAISIAKALALTHDKGILHRDIKPANIFCCEDNSFVLLDFGLSISDEYCTALTKTGFVVGTPVYMAPEQMTSNKVGAAADINSFGLVLFHLLARRLPFDFTKSDYFNKRMMEETPSLAEFAPEVPDSFVKVVDKCLKLSPTERYANGGELLSDLEKINLEVAPTVDLAQEPSQSEWLKALPLLAPVLLALFLLVVHFGQEQAPEVKVQVQREMTVTALYPTELVVEVSASPPCRATINIYGEKDKEPQSSYTKLVDGKARVEFIVKARSTYRLVTIFAGRPQKEIERFVATPYVRRKAIAWPPDLPAGKLGLRFVPHLLVKDDKLAVVTRQDGTYCSDFNEKLHWYKKSNLQVRNVAACEKAIYSISVNGVATAQAWADGKPLWQSESFGQIGKYCRVAADKLLFRTLEPKSLVALSLATGKVLWRSSQKDFSENWSVVQGKILAALISGGSQMVDLASGELSKGPQMAGSGFITTYFVGDKDSIYVGNYVKAVLGGPWNGPRRFRTYLRGEPRILVSNKKHVVVLCKAPNELLVLDADNGKIKWSHKLIDVVNYIEVANERIYLVELGGNQPCRLKVLREGDGRLLALHHISSHQPAKPALYSEGVILAPRQSSVFALPLFSKK